MQRRKFFVGLGSLAAGGTAALGTGALSSAQVDRSVTVDVQNDDSAYLTLVPATDGSGNATPNSQFAVQNSDGELEVAFDDSGNGGTGVNPDGTFVFEDVFEIQNQGTQEVQVTLSDGGGGDTPITIESPGSIATGSNPLSSGTDEIAAALASGTPDGDNDGNVEITTGSSVNVSFAVSTDGGNTNFPTLNPLQIDAEDADDN